MLPKKLDRWVLRRFGMAMLVVTVTLTGLYVVADLAQRVDELVRSANAVGWGRTAYVAAGYYSMGTIRYLFEFTELIFIGAAAALMVGLLKSGEAAAVQGMGRSLRRLLLPVLLVSVAFGIIQVVASEGLLPFVVRQREVFRAELVGSRVMSGVVFPAEGADAVVGVGYAGEEGRVKDMVVMQRMDDGFRIVRVESAAWGSRGELHPECEVEVLMGTEGREGMRRAQPSSSTPRHDEEPLALETSISITPAAALRLRMLGPSAVRMRELVLLGGGRMLAELGSRLGGILLLVGAVMMIIGVLAWGGSEATAGRGVVAFLVVEFVVRVADATFLSVGAATFGVAAVMLGMAAGIIVFAFGACLFARMPT